jgi:DNA-binding MarR family transcriptional regulator
VRVTEEDPLARAELTFLLGMAFQVLHTEFVAQVRATGADDLRPVHAMLLQVLRRGGATGTELAAELGVTKQAAGQLVDRLEKLGHVRRLPHPDGGRRRLVVLTERAMEYLDGAGQVLHALEERLAADPDMADLSALRRQLAQVIRHFTGDEIPPLRPLW